MKALLEILALGLLILFLLAMCDGGLHWQIDGTQHSLSISGGK